MPTLRAAATTRCAFRSSKPPRLRSAAPSAPSGQYHEALAAVKKALEIAPYSIHLKAAKHTLLLKSEGKSVPPRLEKFAGDDNGYLRQFVCPLPFERFDIGPDGQVLVCCGHWLPTHIGNILHQPVNDVLNSPMAKAIRQSVTDGSYKYCNHLECGTMAQDALPRREELLNLAHAQGRRRAELRDGRRRRDLVRVRSDLQSVMPVLPHPRDHGKSLAVDRKGARRRREAAAAAADAAHAAYQSGWRAVRQQAVAKAAGADQRRTLPRSQARHHLQRHSVQPRGMEQVSRHPQQGAVGAHLRSMPPARRPSRSCAGWANTTSLSKTCASCASCAWPARFRN